MNPILDRLLSKKFVLAALALICLAVLCAVKSIDGAQFITGLGLTVGAYLTANVAQKAMVKP